METLPGSADSLSRLKIFGRMQLAAPQSLGLTTGETWGDIRRKTGPTNTLYMLADEFDEIHG